MSSSRENVQFPASRHLDHELAVGRALTINRYQLPANCSRGTKTPPCTGCWLLAYCCFPVTDINTNKRKCRSLAAREAEVLLDPITWATVAALHSLECWFLGPNAGTKARPLFKRKKIGFATKKTLLPRLHEP